MVLASNKPPFLKKIILAAAIFFVFFAGLLAGHRHVFPLGLMKEVFWKAPADDWQTARDPILKFAFTRPLSMRDPQLYPPSLTYDEISERINHYLLDVSLFKNAYQKIRIIETSYQGHIFKLVYQLGPQTYEAYAYFHPRRKAGALRTASLIIPGSGPNQASAIFYKNPENYQGNTLTLTEDFSDSFVFVKPNMDFLAIHDGRKRLSFDYILTYLLNKGGSYSAHYVASSLAITKYLKTEYQKVFVLGLSQGGQAALLNSMQSSPDAAVIASGFSVLLEKLLLAGFDQLIIPGLDINSGSKVLSTVIRQRTQYLFTYGTNEEAYYWREAHEGHTRHFFKDLRNVTVLEHEGGHVFPEAVKPFLAAQTESNANSG